MLIYQCGELCHHRRALDTLNQGAACAVTSAHVGIAPVPQPADPARALWWAT
jgi:hypothetical protein